jgi:hypothetical protein
MANEVWTEVFSFMKRIEMAKVSLTNRHIHQICWPRLHGNKVMAHEVKWMIIKRLQSGWPAIDIDGTKVEFADSPPPGYITRFRFIQIEYVNA